MDRNHCFWSLLLFLFYSSLQNKTDQMKCHKYLNSNESCSEWQYDRTQFDKSIITEFNLVCNRAFYATLTQSFFMLGYVASGFIFSHYSDLYGRRPIVWISYIIEVLAIISCGLSFNIYQYLISRFFVGLGHSGGAFAIYAILIECCGPKHRSDIVILAGIGWVMGYIVLPIFAYFFQDFRHMQLISSLPMILLLIWFYYLYESPRWQILNGKLEEAEITLRKAVKLNGRSDENLTEQLKQLFDYLQKSQSEEESKKKYTLLDLIKTSNLRKFTFILWYTWIVCALIYYGLSFNMSDFGGNFYITFLLAGLAELPGQLLPALLLRFIGRRKLFALFMLIITASSLAVILSNTDALRVTFAVLSKFGVSSAWNVLSIQAAEIYPTLLRHRGIGVGAVVGRIGSISAPFMKDFVALTSLTWLMVFYALLSLIAAFLQVFLPETKDREIPDTIKEAENLHQIEMKTIEKK